MCVNELLIKVHDWSQVSDLTISHCKTNFLIFSPPNVTKNDIKKDNIESVKFRRESVDK